MTGIDPTKLEYIRDSLWRIDEPSRHQNPETPQEIRGQLAAMGLNLNDDTTYELLRDGWTKQSFDDLEFLNITYSITRNFHSVQNLGWQQYSGLIAGSKHTNTRQLIEMIDHYLPQLKNRQLPANADPYHRLILQTLLDDHASGKLQEYCAGLAVDDAVETYERTKKHWAQTLNSLKSKDAGENLHYYNEIYPAKQVKDLVAGMTPDRRTTFFSLTGTDQAGLDSLHKEIVLNMVCELLKTWRSDPEPKWESGQTSDHGYTFALEQFEEAGIDMSDDAVYAFIGMDRATFWDNYQKQVVHITNANGRPPAKIYTPPVLKP